MPLEAFKDLPKCGKLASFSMNETPCGSRITRVLAQCPSLEIITLYAFNFDNADLLPLVGLTKLRALSFGPDREGRITSEAGLEVLARMRSLEDVWIFRLNLPEGKLGFLPQMRNVTKFALTDSKLSQGAYASIAAMPSLRSVAFERLDTIPDPNFAGDVLCELAKCKQLDTLYFQDTRVTAEVFPDVPPLPRLANVAVTGRGRVSDAWVISLLAVCRNLRTLDLEASRLSGQAIAAIAGSKSLDGVILRNASGFEPDWITHLASMKGLTSLSLEGSPVTDADLPGLGALHFLRGLNVSGTRVTKEGVNKLKAALPECNIVQ